MLIMQQCNSPCWSTMAVVQKEKDQPVEQMNSGMCLIWRHKGKLGSSLMVEAEDLHEEEHEDQAGASKCLLPDEHGAMRK